MLIGKQLRMIGKKKIDYMPPLRNHTHCQVAQKADTKSKTCQRVWPPQLTDRLHRIKHENLTKAIRNLGNMLILKFIALNKIDGKLKINSFKIPNYA